MLWFNFTLGLIFVFFCLKLIIIKLPFPKTKVNHNNIYGEEKNNCGTVGIK